MEDKLRRYVDDLFTGTAPTKKAVELKEEMIQNLQDKYNDLLSEGKTQEAAYNIAVAGIGDVSALIQELEHESDAFDGARERSAMITSIAVMTYILSVLPLIVLSMFGYRYSARIGVPLMFLLIASATGMLVYNGMTRPRHQRSDTMVDEFREWQSDTRQQRSLRRSISAALWTIITALYFIISFWTFAWHVTWIIFIIGAAIEAVINIFYSLRK